MKSVSTGSPAMPRCTNCDSHREAGFSLVEVLCALAIAALALSALYRGLGSSLLAARHLEGHLGARVIAQSILTDELHAAATAAAVRSGQSGAYAWRLTIAPAGSDVAVPLPRSYRLYRLTADITWDGGGHFTLDTLKLGTP